MVSVIENQFAITIVHALHLGSAELLEPLEGSPGRVLSARLFQGDGDIEEVLRMRLVFIAVNEAVDRRTSRLVSCDILHPLLVKAGELISDIRDRSGKILALGQIAPEAYQEDSIVTL